MRESEIYIQNRFSKAVITLLLFCTVFQLANSQTIISGGETKGNWTKSNSPYIIENDIIISIDSLTIEPGVIVVFKDSVGITVENSGFIKAIGNVSDSIKFITESGKHWKGIEFLNPNEVNQSMFEYCSFNGGSREGNGGVLRVVSYNNLLINNCVFSENRSLLNGGAINITNSSIKISGCLITNNYSEIDGGGIYLEESNSVISNCIIEKNEGRLGGGMYIWRGKPIINNSTIRSNTARSTGGGIWFSFTSSSVLNNCNVVKNRSHSHGGGIEVYYSSPKIINSTIAGNLAQDYSYGGGIFITSNSSPELRNTIIWGNSSYSYNQVSSVGSPSFYNCCIEGGNTFGAPNYENCIETDPEFIDFDNENFAITSSSPCINAGDTNNIQSLINKSDIIGNTRIWSDTIDIGSNEYIPPVEQTKLIDVPSMIDFGEVPINKTKTKRLNITNTGNVALEISSIITASNVFFCNWYGQILAGSTKSLNVIYSPISQLPHSANINISSDADNGPKSIALQGAGIPAQHLVSLTTSGEGHITPDFVDTICSHGEYLLLEPTPIAGWQFKEWQLGGSNIETSNLSLTIVSDTTIHAVFTRAAATLELAKDGLGSIFPESDTICYWGDSISLSAHPDMGWKFDKWVIGDNEVYDKNIKIHMISDTLAIAHFKKVTCELSFSTVGNGTIIPLSDTICYWGDSISLSAHPDMGWKFDKWVIGDNEVYDENIKMYMTSDTLAIAHFKKITCELSFSTIGKGTTIPLSDTICYWGDSILLSAFPDKDWLFEKWIINDVEIFTNPYFIRMYNDTTINVVFTSISNINKIKESSFVLYPNPTKKLIFINGIAHHEISAASILDIDGKLLLSGQISEDLSIDVSALPSGIYFIKINRRNKSDVVQRFTKY